MKFLVLICALLMPLQALSAERVLWQQGQTLNIELSSDVERKIVFPEPVRVGMRPEFAELFRQSIIENVLYITAVAEFKERVLAQGLESGHFYVLDVTAGPGALRAREDFVIQLRASSPGSIGTDPEPPARTIPGSVSELSPIDLVQYASQSLYAPSETLIEPKPGIRRVAVKSRLIPHLYRGGAFQAEVLAGWGAGGMYVTAVKLTNTTNQMAEFEPCRIRGDFYSVTPQFRRAQAAGHRTDFTVVYLLSEKPFDAAVQGGGLLCV